jgi:hypothetical protein
VPSRWSAQAGIELSQRNVEFGASPPPPKYCDGVLGSDSPPPPGQVFLLKQRQDMQSLSCRWSLETKESLQRAAPTRALRDISDCKSVSAIYQVEVVLEVT